MHPCDYGTFGNTLEPVFGLVLAVMFVAGILGIALVAYAAASGVARD